MTTTYPQTPAGQSIYESVFDIINDHIIPALGEAANEFDIDAIAEEITEAYTEYNDEGAQVARRTGFIVREDVDFWDVVACHEK